MAFSPPSACALILLYFTCWSVSIGATSEKPRHRLLYSVFVWQIHFNFRHSRSKWMYGCGGVVGKSLEGADELNLTRSGAMAKLRAYSIIRWPTSTSLYLSSFSWCSPLTVTWSSCRPTNSSVSKKHAPTRTMLSWPHWWYGVVRFCWRYRHWPTQSSPIISAPSSGLEMTTRRLRKRTFAEYARGIRQNALMLH